jgi:hypothetical protein
VSATIRSGAALAIDFSKPNADYPDLLRLLCMTDMAVAADHVNLRSAASEGRLADRPSYRQMANHDPVRQICDARYGIDVARSKHRPSLCGRANSSVNYHSLPNLAEPAN